MPRILISASFPEQLLARQLPDGKLCWGEFEFLLQPDGQPVDAWAVYDNLQRPIQQVCPPANTLLITGEPPSIRQYRSRFTSQFGQIWTSHASICHSYVTRQHEAQHWHFGLFAGQLFSRQLTYADLCSLARPKKNKLVSVLCSSKTATADHRRRLEFVKQLKSTLGNQLDVLGNGIQPVDDKADAILPYRYHIVLENDHHDHFMTEKLPDAFLGWSYPIYFGGPEASRRFPNGSFTPIDIYQTERSIHTIRDVIFSQKYEESIEQTNRARDIVLNELNIFAMLADYWRSHLKPQPAATITLLPKSYSTRLTLRQLGRIMSPAPRRRAA